MPDDSHVHSKIAEHGQQIARQEAAIKSLAKTTESLAQTVGKLPDQISQGLTRVYDRLDTHEQRTRPDVKWVIGSLGMGLSLLMAAFSIVLVLTVDPIRGAITGLSESVDVHMLDYSKHAQEGAANDAKAEIRHDYHTKWNEAQHEYIVELRRNERQNSIDIARLDAREEARHENMVRWNTSIDDGGSRVWNIKEKAGSRKNPTSQPQNTVPYPQLQPLE